MVSRRWLGATVAAITVRAATVTATPADADRAESVTSWARHETMPLDTVEPGAPLDDLAAVSAYPGTRTCSVGLVSPNAGSESRHQRRNCRY